MTHMLASVLDATEAEIALDAGADIIDLKDARNGALGALPLGVVGEALKAVGGQRPVSATLGNLPMEPELLRESALALGATGIDFVKVGLFDEPSRADCIEALAQVAGKHRLVGVLFADQRPALDLLPPLARAGFAGVMLDTMAKSGGGLRRHMDQGALRDFVAAARAHWLFCGLAGSLGVADIAPLLELEPDYLGFRGALCAGAQRDARLDATAVAAVRRVIPQYPPNRAIGAAHLVRSQGRSIKSPAVAGR